MIGISRRYVPAAKPLIKKVSGKKIIVNVSAAISPLTTPRIFRFRAAENALIKARTVGERLKVSALADDSGLCVDALGGAPGVKSARYAEADCGGHNDDRNIDLLLKNLAGVTERGARFKCCMVYYSDKGDILTATGEVSGEITLKREGTNGFGYDPVFYSYELKKTMGEATAEEKNSVSHRKRALEKIIELIENYEKG